MLSLACARNVTSVHLHIYAHCFLLTTTVPTTRDHLPFPIFLGWRLTYDRISYVLRTLSKNTKDAHHCTLSCGL